VQTSIKTLNFLFFGIAQKKVHLNQPE